MANHDTGDGWIRVDLAHARTTNLEVDLPELVQQEIEECEQALADARARGNRMAEGKQLLQLGRKVFFHGQFARGLECLQQAVSLFHDIGDLCGEAQGRTILGELPIAIMTDPESARQHLLQAMQIYLELEDYAGVASGYCRLAEIYSISGQANQARELYLKATFFFRTLGDRGQEANALGRLALIDVELGRVREALACSEQALAICQEVGDRQREAGNLQTLAICYARLGQTERAIELDGQALDIYRELGDQQHEAFVLAGIGTLYLVLRQMDKAIEAAAAAVQILDEIGGPGADEAREGLAHIRKVVAKKWWQFWL